MLYTIDKPKKICPKSFSFELEDGLIRNLKFVGGCEGNLKGLARLTEEKPAAEIAELLAGVSCGSKGTSCPNELSLALKKALSQQKKKTDKSSAKSSVMNRKNAPPEKKTASSKPTGRSRAELKTPNGASRPSAASKKKKAAE
jgi:uncharacterized protein (TIGR03905 family)